MNTRLATLLVALLIALPTQTALADEVLRATLETADEATQSMAHGAETPNDISTTPSPLTLRLEIEGVDREFRLKEKTGFLADDYVAEVSEMSDVGEVSTTIIDRPLMRFYDARGMEGFAALSIGADGQIRGLASLGDRFYALESDQVDAAESHSLDIHELSTAELQALAGSCGLAHHVTNPDESVTSIDSNLDRPSNLSDGPPVSSPIEVPARIVEIATEAAPSFVSLKGGASNANAEALAILNNVDTWFRAQMGIRIVVPYQHAWSGSSPYNATPGCESNGDCLADAVSGYWKVNQFPQHPSDLVQYFTATAFSVPAYGLGSARGMGDLGGVCGLANGFGFSYVVYQGSASATAYTAAHEIGHNFSYEHDVCGSGDNWIMCSSHRSSNFSPRSLEAIIRRAELMGRNCLSSQGAGIAPEIVSPSQNLVVEAGSPVTLSVDVSSQLPVAYRWRFNGQASALGYGPTLRIPSVRPVDVGTYTVEVINVFGVSSQSYAVALSPNGIPATLTSVPSSIEVEPGTNVELVASGSGTAPLRFGWKRNGNTISGAFSQTLQLGSISFSDSGDYTVTVTNSFGSDESLPIRVFVVGSPPSPTPTPGVTPTPTPAPAGTPLPAAPFTAQLVAKPGQLVMDGTSNRSIINVGWWNYLTEDGSVLYEANLSGVPLSPIYNSSITSRRNALLRQSPDASDSIIVKTGDAMPGAPIGSLSEFTVRNVSDAGAVCLNGVIRQSGQVPHVKVGLWSLFQGNKTYIWDENTNASYGLNFSSVNAPAAAQCLVNGAWDISGTRCGSREWMGLFAQTAPGQYRMLGQSAHPAPGTGMNFSLGMRSSTDAMGNFVAVTYLSPTSSYDPTETALYTFRSGSDTTLRLLARDGQPIIGAERAATFERLATNFGIPTLTASGRIVFPAQVRDSIGARESAILMTSLPHAGAPLPAIEFLARPGDAVLTDEGSMIFAGLFQPRSVLSLSRSSDPLSAAFGDLDAKPAYWAAADGSRIIFFAHLNDPLNPSRNTVALVESIPSSAQPQRRVLRSVLAVGERLPGSQLTLSAYRLGFNIVSNRYADLLMWAKVSGPSVTESNDGALIQVRNGRPALVAREGTRLGRAQSLFLGDNCLRQEPYASNPTLARELGYVEHKLILNDQGQGVVEPLIRSTQASIGINNYNGCYWSGILGVTSSAQLFTMAMHGDAVTVPNGQADSSIGWPQLVKGRSFNNLGDILYYGYSPSGVNFMTGLPYYSSTLDRVLRARVPACGADYNRDGAITLSDLNLFLEHWFARAADFTSDGETSVQDLLSFLQAFMEGC